MRLVASVFVALLAVLLGPGTRADEVLTGINALPAGRPAVTASLAASESGPLRRMLDVAMTPFGASAPVSFYETELSKKLHVIAISADLRDFVHEHGEAPGQDGHFHIAMTFPHAGLWHVYADGVPQGLGQQVMRFDFALGNPPKSGATPPVAPTGLRAADGRYAARFDDLGLAAGREAALSLHLTRDGQPAPDVKPYLGVAAHAVLINAADLTYVHVHAVVAKPPGSSGAAAMEHDMHDAAVPMPAMEDLAPPVGAGSALSPDLSLHVRAPKAGTYVLWVQFNGGDAVRTVRFVVPVGGQ